MTLRSLPPRAAVLMLAAALWGCGLFEPRDPEEPAQGSLNFPPQTDPAIVVSNLQNSISVKNVANYAACFVDQPAFTRPFSFTPSTEASAQYPGVLGNWSIQAERDYFQNLIAKSPANGFAGLTLTLKAETVSADSVLYDFDYLFTFEHTEPEFPRTARGSLRFTIVRNASNFWAIADWLDYKTTDDATWSLFKGKFSN
ncbi:MAG: hypothetical protein H6Q29_269 [Bacteroidetes bacterium]|nr:hypothetical protein [Bacteroidota bacterium]